MKTQAEEMKDLKAHLAILNRQLKNLNKSVKALKSINGKHNIHGHGIGAIKKQVGFTLCRIEAVKIDIDKLKKGIKKDSIQLFVSKDLPL